jgi:ribosomal protein L21
LNKSSYKLNEVSINYEKLQELYDEIKSENHKLDENFNKINKENLELKFELENLKNSELSKNLINLDLPHLINNSHILADKESERSWKSTRQENQKIEYDLESRRRLLQIRINEKKQEKNRKRKKNYRQQTSSPARTSGTAEAPKYPTSLKH